MVQMDNDQFLNELTKMFQAARSAGTVRLSMKRFDGHTRPAPKPGSGKPPLPAPAEYRCLVRASLGHSRKISTVVGAKDVNKFHISYASVLKANMDGLKKREKNKTKPKAKIT